MFNIDNHSISTNSSPYIIAELSANHNGSLLKAKQSIEAAHQSGANAVKIQTYTADTMTIDSEKDGFIINGGLWDGYSLYKLYQEASTPFEWHPELFSYAQDLGITIFSTPFDETAVDLLDELNTPAYKVSSFELCDIPLIKYIAKKQKPMLMSTGMASIGEVKEAVYTARKYGCEKLLLFHCISSYPAPIEQANLRNLLFLRKEFQVEVGLSDHTIGNTAAIASIALGASAIEKHFTLNRQDKGPDSVFSIEPTELKDLIKLTNQAWRALGTNTFCRSESEEGSKIFRRSLYFINSLKRGAILAAKDIRRIRPGYGLEPKYEKEVIGKKLLFDIERGDPVKWELFE